MSLESLQQKIGYEFKDKSLLNLAITHKSSNNFENNERLEFLGDSVLNSVISQYLFSKFPNEKEGLLTRMRSYLVKGETLTVIANEMNLSEFIKLSKGTANLSQNRKYSILEGAIESIIGAVLLDSNWEQANSFVLNLLQKELANIATNKEFRDSKTELQELIQSQKINLPKYQTIPSSEGFESSLEYKDNTFMAKGTSKRQAESSVAKKVLAFIKQKNV
mgnify:FL=1